MSPKPFANPGRVGLCLTILLILLGCKTASSPAPLRLVLTSSPTGMPVFIPSSPTATARFSPTPTETPAPTVTSNATSTATRCRGFVWAHGTVPPAFNAEVQEAMESAGLEGTVRASTFGETDSCGNYYAAQVVDYVFTVQVGELERREDIARKLAIVREIVRRFAEKGPGHGVGNLGVTFKSGELQCAWRFEEEPWELFPVAGANGAGCLLPANDLTRPLAAALAALSVDLGCESFTMTAGMFSVMLLECERAEGANRYTVAVTFDLDSGGSEGTCFHGWPAHETNLSGSKPVTVIEDGTTFYEQERSFEWTTNNLVTRVYERIRGEQGATFPLDTHEKVYLRALQEGVIRGAGTGANCP